MDNAENKKETKEDNTYSLCELCTNNTDGLCMVWHIKTDIIQATSCKHFGGFIKK